MEDELTKVVGDIAPDETITESEKAPADADVNADTAPDTDVAADNGAAEPVTSDADVKAEAEGCPPREKGFRAWWKRHKPSTRRLIQVYSFLLYNAYARGFIKGEIFKGASKTVCVPGLNCYSCPGAVGACPLGALQNALTAAHRSAPYYMIGIMLLYGLIFARTVCGFLCPIGLGQDLLYKIKTPKLKKSRVTYVLSYLKYVILAVLVIGIPLVYTIDQTVVPGFCKYICPAGTFEGAFMLLVNPANDSMYQMLGGLFTWKTAVLICVITASIFIYRFFCRFLCPLGAFYGLFNRFALLGVKVDRSKCTDCGKCVDKCKMDIRKVGDHECINCGECMSVCPTKAITWKGGKIFMRATDPSIAPESERPVLAKATEGFTEEPSIETAATSCGDQAAKKKYDRVFWVRLSAIIIAALLYIGVFVYANFFAVAKAEKVSGTYEFAVGSNSGRSSVSFKIGDSSDYVVPASGEGTQDNPYVLKNINGIYEVMLSGGEVYFKYTTSSVGNFTVKANSDLSLKINYELAGNKYGIYDYAQDGAEFSLDLKLPEKFGSNKKGYVCYDFTLDGYNGVDKVTLSDYRAGEGKTGKVVVVNFWGIWCGPCVTELPEFEAVRKKYTDVEVIAVHSYLDGSGAQEFLNSKGWNEWGVIFAQDTGTNDRSDTYALLGGGGNNSYPRTLVLNADGVITDIFEGAIKESTLDTAVKNAGATAA